MAAIVFTAVVAGSFYVAALDLAERCSDHAPAVEVDQ